MKRNKLNNNFSFDNQESGSPMDGVQNMSDAMLVLAVGIMLALVINWKIDIKDTVNGQKEKVELEDEALQEFDMEDAKEDSSVSIEDVESNFVKYGTVYVDEKTGKQYLVED